VSSAEAIVVPYALAEQRASKADQIRSSGLPRSTFQQVRQRVYAEQWLEDRYVPNPSLLGISTVTFALARPYSERLAETVRGWSEDASAVLLWSGHESVLAVFFGRPTKLSNGPNLGTSRSPVDRAPRILSIDNSFAGIPVYFDFEGVWASFAGRSGTLSYPLPLRTSSLDRRGEPLPDASLPERERLNELVCLPFREGARTHPYHLPRSQQRTIREGRASFRTFLSPSRIPSFRGRRLTGVAWIHGDLIRAGAASGLFRALVEGSRVRPFLFVSDGSQALIGAVSQSPPPEDSTFRGREAVVGTLKAHLSNIDVVREPFESLNVGLNHRYDRLARSAHD